MRQVGLMGYLEDKKRARTFYRYFSLIYDYVNPLFYSKDMRRKVVDMAELRDGMLVLEVGSGTGYTSEEIISRVGIDSLVALDQSIHMYMRAREKFPLKFVRGDAENLPFKNDAFDAVISAGSIEYWPNPQKGVNEIYRVTKPGGKAVIIGPNKPKSAFFKKIAESIMLFPSVEEYRSWYENAGFRNIEIEIVGPNSLWRTLAVIIAGEK